VEVTKWKKCGGGAREGGKGGRGGEGEYDDEERVRMGRDGRKELVWGRGGRKKARGGGEQKRRGGGVREQVGVGRRGGGGGGRGGS